MFCVNCGSKLQGKFCQECGTPVGGATPQMEQVCYRTRVVVEVSEIWNLL